MDVTISRTLATCNKCRQVMESAQHVCKAPERVVHPQHYGGDTTHETWNCLEAWGLEAYALRWNAAKYISRAHRQATPEKELEDLKKARQYLDREIRKLEGKA